MEYKSYKFRIYPNKAQEELIHNTFGCVRFVYNHFLEDLIIAHDDLGEVRTYFQQCKDLTSLKYEHIWLREADSSALKYALRALNASYKNFYRGLGHSSLVNRTVGNTGIARLCLVPGTIEREVKEHFKLASGFTLEIIIKMS